MNNKSYTSTHNHSEYSNLRLIDSINKVDDLIQYAYDLGLNGLALTDHDAVSGHLKAIEKYESILKKSLKEKCSKEEFDSLNVDKLKINELYNVAVEKDIDFKLILGNEIYLCSEGLTEENYSNATFYHVILLATDEIGHRQIREISSRAWKRAFFRMMLRVPTYPSDLFDIVDNNKGHLICTTACLGGYTGKMYKLYKEALNDKDDLFLSEEKPQFYLDKIDNFLEMMQELFGKDYFYIEVQPSNQIDQISYNEFMYQKYKDKYNFIYATDSHYLRKEDKELHKDFLNSKSSNDREVDDFYASAYMMSKEEVYSYFDYFKKETLDKMTDNLQKINEKCQPYTLLKEQIITKVIYDKNIIDNRDIFEDLEDKPYIQYYRDTDYEPDKYFFELVCNGFAEKVPTQKWNKYVDTLEIEMETIKKISDQMGKPLSDYFTSMAKMIDIIWNEADSIVGPSRGSAGSFLTNYLLGITQMNPLEQELEFYPWRFLNTSRVTMADIDIDTESAKRQKVFNKIQAYFNSIGGDLVNICTFGTEGSKSAIRTAARGLNIDLDVVTYLTSMIPNERGFDWSLSQCYNGDKEHTAISAFKAEMDQYPRLWQVASSIEGLVTRLGVHASGVVAINGDFVNNNSFMKTSKEVVVSAFDLHDSEKMGSIKYDLLTVSALDRIRQTMNYLLEDGRIEWQGNLRSTYNKYLHPDILDYESPEMWDMVDEGKVTALFQFDTVVGSQAVKKIKPRSVLELAIGSSVMRLMGDGELPLEVYARYKNDINLWYDEINQYDFAEEEKKILEKYLLKLSGVADSQESLMIICQDPHISGFTLKEADRLRKTIAKKDFREIDTVKELFYTKGHDCGTSQKLLDYIWNVQVARQLGYSFCAAHTNGYALIALQEANLAYTYPIIYWNAACLSVDSSAINEEDFNNLIDEDIIEISDEADSRTNNKMDYSKIASAIDKFRKVADIELPDINKSKLGFTPDAQNNSILYGLKGISRITSPVISEIMSKRPYSSLNDFVEKVTKRIVTKDKIVNLIKCGAFNSIENKSTEEILKEFILSVSDQKKKLTLQNLNMLIDLELIPDEFKFEKEIYKTTKEFRKNRDENRFYYKWCFSEEKMSDFKYSDMIQYMNVDGGQYYVIDSSKWDGYVYEPNMDKIRKYIKTNHDELLVKLNNKLFEIEWEKYASGDEKRWELDSLNFYYSEHPLLKVQNQVEYKGQPINLTNLEDIVEDAQDGFFLIKGKEIPKMKLYGIIGTVLDKDKTKGLVTLQCPSGVVQIKVYKDLFSTFMSTVYREDGSMQDVFFEKGVHLLVVGTLRGTTFIPKVYKSTGLKSIYKINLDENGNFKNLEEKENANSKEG